MSPLSRALSPGPTVLFVLALLAFYIAARVVGPAGEDSAYPILLTVAAITLAVAIALRAMSWTTAGAASVFVKGWLASVGAALLGALFVVVVQTPEAVSEEEGLASLLLVMAILLLTAGSLIAFALQWAAMPMREADHVEPPRLGFAAMTAAIVVSALGGVAALNYVVAEKEWRADLSFGAPTKPSLATRSLIQASTSPVEVFLFFERGSPVITEVGDYFDGLAEAGAQVERLDSALDPVLSKDLKVSKNGTVAFRVGERTDTWFLGTERDQARRKLKKVDEEVATRLSKLTRGEKTIYFTVGHGEREEKKAGQADRAGSAILFNDAEALNVKKKKLGLGEGLGREIPNDADLVAILGPTNAFLDAEVDALVAYIERGGALLLTLDPGVDLNLDRVLAALDLTVEPGEVCNDKEYVVRTRTAADHNFIISTSFTSHKAISTLSSARGRAALLLLGTAPLKKVTADKAAAAGKAERKVTFLARSRSGSFADRNGNRVFDEAAAGGPKEERAIYDLVAAVEIGEAAKDGEEKETLPARAVVVGDSEALADSLMPNDANRLFGADAVRWLLRDDAAAGAFFSDEDVPIFHTKDGDSAWFYGTSFLAPLIVLGIGAGLVRVRRRRRRS